MRSTKKSQIATHHGPWPSSFISVATLSLGLECCGAHIFGRVFSADFSLLSIGPLIEKQSIFQIARTHRSLKSKMYITYLKCGENCGVGISLWAIRKFFTKPCF